MLGAQDQDTVKTLSYTTTGGDNGTGPIPLPRTTSPPRNQDSQSKNPFDDEETASTSSGVVGSVGDGSKEPIYATIDPSTKSPKKTSSSDNWVDDQNFTPMRRSDSQETIYSTPLRGSDEAIKDLTREFERLSNGSGTPSTASPSGSYDADSQADSNTPLITPNKRTNRFWPRAKYAMQQKNFIIPAVSATFITMYLATYAASAFLQNKGLFITFITNNPKFLTVPGIIAASLFAIGIACAVKKFYNIVECQIEKKNPEKILDKVLELQPKDKIIKSVRLEYGNNTHSNFTFNTWKSHNDFINIDEKVIKSIGLVK